MDKLRRLNLREPVVEVATKQAVTAAQRIRNPDRAAREAAARRRNETRWSWYLREVVQRAR